MSVLPNQKLAQECRAVVVSVDYRLAPETPHPGPLEDCYAALKYVHNNAASLGIDPTRIAVAGESAGGGLAAGLALLARDPVSADHPPASDLPDDRRPDLRHRRPPSIHRRVCLDARVQWFGWSSLLACNPGDPDVSPYAAAARAEELEGLPSSFIAVGALDLFAEEDIEYARRLMRTRACLPNSMSIPAPIMVST